MKKAAFLLWIAAALLALSGCRVIRIEEAERTPLKIYSGGQRPDTGGSGCSDRGKEGCGISDDLSERGKIWYLIKGYGRQMSGGYSIQVTELSLSSAAVLV